MNYQLVELQVLYAFLLLSTVVILAFRTTTHIRINQHGPQQQQQLHRSSFDRNTLYSTNININDAFVIPSDLYEHRCYYQPCLQKTTRSLNDKKDHYEYPLLVICIGMAQTITQYQFHVRYLAQNRNVLLYQAEGLGLHYHNMYTSTTGTTTDCSTTDCSTATATVASNISSSHPNISLRYQAMQLRQAICYFYFNQNRTSEETDFSNDRTLTTVTPISATVIAAHIIPSIHVDIVGFSLGGRIALAFIVIQFTKKPELDENVNICIRKVHLTGVSIRRSPYGTVQGMIWADLLWQNRHNNQNDLRSFGWSILSAAYSPNFLYQNRQYLHQWVQSVCSSHTSNGILHLIEQAYEHENDPTNPWSVENMIQQISSLLSNDSNNNNNATIQFRCLVGEFDVLALPEHVSEMVHTLRNHTSTSTTTTTSTVVIIVDDVVVPNVGHAVPIESSRFWRDDIQSYISAGDGLN